MRNTQQLLTVMVCILLAPALWAAGAGEANGADGGMGEESAPLPVSHVTLYTSGVGEVTHRETVVDDAELRFEFSESVLNDLLKSLVVYDYGGGRVGSARFSGRQPLDRILRSFSVDLSYVQSLRSLLDATRGELVEIRAPGLYRGRILGTAVENEDPEGRVMLSVVDDGRVRSVPIDEIQSIQYARRELQRDLDEALSIIGRETRRDVQSLELSFEGTGTRDVEVTYVREMPVWKVSYRLDLDDDGATMQMWAIIENTTDQDWNGVNLRLVSGRPISFTMDLATPRYAPRPNLSPEVSSFVFVPPAAPGAESNVPGAFEDVQELMLNSNRQQLMERERFTAFPEDRSRQDAGVPIAQGAALGNYFVYEIEEPVDIPRHQSATVPIARISLDAEELSLFNPMIYGERPLLGTVLTNTGEYHLSPGPITVFHDGAYAGDARILDVLPDDEVTIRYAVDLDRQVTQRSSYGEETVRRVFIDGGLIRSERRDRRETIYEVQGDDTAIMIEHPISSGWELVEPATEVLRGDEYYRIAVSDGELRVVEERVRHRSIGLFSAAPQELVVYIENEDLSDELRGALRRVRAFQVEGERLGNALEEARSFIDGIFRAQERIRQNMEVLDREGELYRRYVSELITQEDRLVSLNREIETLSVRIRENDEAFRAYVRDLVVE